MGNRLEGKVALITGAGLGIGRGVSRRYAREGATVVVAEINDANGRRTADELAGLGGAGFFVQTDVGERDQVEAAVQAAIDEFGRIDILINNAWGGGGIGRIEWKTQADMEHGFRIGFYAAMWGMQAAFPHMKAQGGGSIINLCSLNGVNAHMFSVDYNAAKEALRALSRTAAVEWGRHNIRTNVICPAAATEAYVGFRDANPETAAEMLKENPMGRMGDPENDIGGVALFLASEDSQYVNGNTLFVDGGAHVNGVSWRPDLPEEMPSW
jgi:NAD(P)-dependent dehydrogenase (short-subunit alcohol dehydrogenase family)